MDTLAEKLSNMQHYYTITSKQFTNCMDEKSVRTVWNFGSNLRSTWRNARDQKSEEAVDVGEEKSAKRPKL